MVVTTAAEWLVLPLISALIGYITSVIAVRMLFRPRRPWRLWGVGTIQGLIPKRHHDLAEAIGQVVENELLSIDILLDKLDIDGYKDQVSAAMVRHVRARLKERMPRFIPIPLQDVIIDHLCELIGKEGESILDVLVAEWEDYARGSISIRELVENRILALDLAALEELVVGIAHKELRYIEVLGAAVGFLIGWGQIGILAVLR